MKKRILSLFLAAVMMCLCLPFPMNQKTEAAATLYWPVPGHTNLSQGFHNGNAIDISDGNIAGANIIAAMGGTVTHIFLCTQQHNYDPGSSCCYGFGTGLVISGDDGRIYQYAHMQGGSIPSNVYYGCYVSAGQLIGKVGTTGYSTGNHLHFAISYGNYWNESGINPANESYIYSTNCTFDVNIYADGVKTEEKCTFDVYINNALVANDVKDFYKVGEYAKGTTYKINDIKPVGCLRCKNNTTYSGTINSDVTLDIQLETYHPPKTVQGKAATCTETGLTDGEVCEKCGKTLTAQESIKALGHNYTSVVTPATCTQAGYTTYTCTRCENTYREGGNWSEWTTVKPEGVDEALIDTQVQYRYSDYETKTSDADSMPGYTLVNSEWKQTGSGTIQYVSSWPGGFNTANPLYSQYNKAPKTASETATKKVTVSNSAAGYIYWHWCRGSYSGGPIDRVISDCWENEYQSFSAFFSTTSAGTVDPQGKNLASYNTYYFANGNVCTDSYWWFRVPVNKQVWTEYTKENTFAKWTDWSDWSADVKTASDTRKVETRTVYRIARLPGHSWDDGVVTTPAACAADGVKTFTCTVCKTTKTEKISAVGHNYVYGKCTRCGDALYTAQSADITVGTVNGKKGDTVTVPVAISSNPGFAGFTFKISFDSGLTLTKISKGALLKDEDYGSLTPNVTGKTATWVSPVDTVGNGELLVLTFTVAGTSADGSYAVTLSLANGEETNFVNASGEAIKPVFTAGGVTAGEQHTHDFSVKSATAAYLKSAATCTAAAVYYYKCSGCDEKGSSTYSYGEHAAHKESAWITDKAATATENGSKHTECTVCHTTLRTEVIPKTGAQYDTDTAISVSSAKTSAGKEITLTLALENNPGIAGLSVSLSYNTSVFTLKDVKNGALFSGFTPGKNYVFDNSGNVTADGTLAQFTFSVNENAPAGVYSLDAIVRSCVNEAYNNVEANVKSGTVTVIDFVYGDATGDELIDMKDVVALRQYLAEYDYETGTSSVYVETGADANGDGAINMADVVLLRRYLAYYDYETGTSSEVLGPQ